MYAVSTIAEVLQPIEASLVEPGLGIEHVAIDSRQIVFGSSSIFFAIKGNRTDGHRYLMDAYARGVRTFVVHHENVDVPADCNWIQVEDTTSALQLLAGYHRRNVDIPVVAITGSNGKTWVKEWLTQLLIPDLKVIRSPRSYNSQIGVPLSLLLMRSDHQIAIIEAGISRSGEMEKLERIIRPDVCLITSIGDAHDSGFTNRDEKTEEKLLLARSASIVLCPEFLKQMVLSSSSANQVYSWGESGEADMVVDVASRDSYSELNVIWRGSECSFIVHGTDNASIANSALCALFMYHKGYEADTIAARMGRLRPVSMRLEMHKLNGDSLLINDAYSLDLASLKVALEAVNQHRKGRRVCIILSEIDRQHGADPEKVTQLMREYEIDIVIGIGPEVLSITGPYEDSKFYRDVDSFLSAKPWIELSRTVFLLKGARSFGLDRLVRHMRSRTHSAVLEIDLNAMLNNMRRSVEDLPADTKVIAMVKASAYGSGSIEVAKFLEHHNVGTLCVAYQDEGVELRQAGVTVPIVVLNPDLGNLYPLVEYRLEPVLYSFTLLDDLYRLAEGSQTSLNVHLKIDSGMHRLGFVPAQIEELSRRLSDVAKKVHVASVFTHLAAADDPSKDAFTFEQLGRFEAAYQIIIEHIPGRPIRHVLNSHGTVRLPDFAFEAVRLGIGLYGLVDQPEKDFEPVHRFVARISQLREIAVGESVSYGRRFVAERPTMVATVNAGYADGVPRLAGNGSFSTGVGSDGHLAPIIGSVCMDMFMLDVTDIKEVSVGDEVEIFGPKIPLKTLADACMTIPYELLTGIGPRIPRVFKFD